MQSDPDPVAQAVKALQHTQWAWHALPLLNLQNAANTNEICVTRTSSCELAMEACQGGGGGGGGGGVERAGETWGMVRSMESGMPGSAGIFSITVCVSTAITPAAADKDCMWMKRASIIMTEDRGSAA